MAISVKLKFAGLLRGLLRQLDDRPAAAAPVKTAPAENPAPPRPVSPDGIELPLAAVIAALPMDLRAKLMSVPPVGHTIFLTAETVVGQLAFGAVKISFGELRQLAPGIFANSGGENDDRQVSLPLAEILARLNPALLARRARRKMEVAGEITGPFAGRGQGVTFTSQPLKAPPAAPPVSPAPDNGAPPPAALRPPVSPTVPLAFPPRETVPPAFTPPPQLAGNANNGDSNGHSQTPPGIKFTALPVPPPAMPGPAGPAADVPAILVSLGELAAAWPEAVRDEITRESLAAVRVPFALAEVEPALKRGRVTRAWKELRMLARPGSAPSPHDGLELELPLKVLAPVFLDAQKNHLRPARKVTVAAEIPNLFFGFPQPAEAPVPAFLSRAESPAAGPDFFRENQPAETELRREPNAATDFLSRQTHPKKVVARAVALPGVAGALVALPDGLAVASEVPANLSAATLAAFLPQIYDRVNQGTRELRMGALDDVGFTVGGAPWKIFRVNSVYFAAFGRVGESLPAAQLAQLAAELDRKKANQ